MSKSSYSLRRKNQTDVQHAESALQAARECFAAGRFDDAFDIYERIAIAHPGLSTEVLAEAYDCYSRMKQRDRYTLYQSRIFDFNISPSAKVLDIGSGHHPFPFATHLADISLTEGNIGRAGVPFKHVEGKPVYECNVESMPFADKEFDFVYCSHVLEHTDDPDKACEELMRVARRGYIETPTKAKDLWLNSAKISNHRWNVEYKNDALIFTEYEQAEIEGLQNDIVMKMHVEPQSKREKELSALIYLKPEFVNTMVLWENTFSYKTVYRDGKSSANPFTVASSQSNHIVPAQEKRARIAMHVNNRVEKTLKFMQVHTFYDAYLESFYSRFQTDGMNYSDHLETLLGDGFSRVHLYAPYMSKYNYVSRMIVANDQRLQRKWVAENNLCVKPDSDVMFEILKNQIEEEKPDVLYLSDPITFDSKFIRRLAHKPSLVVGWRAADIPEGTDWSEFDIILSGLQGVLEVAKDLGAHTSRYFIPGFPSDFLTKINTNNRIDDVVFTGSWTTDQHERRNGYLTSLANYVSSHQNPFTLAYYLNGKNIHPLASRFNRGVRFGVPMYQALANGKIVFDSRGEIRLSKHSGSQTSRIDIAGKESINMRIFEATGCGALLLMEAQDNASDFFEAGKEIETFETPKELTDKIQYYLSHDDERRRIANAGHHRCLTEYSIEKRASEFDRIIREALEQKKDTPGPSEVNASNIQLLCQEIQAALNKNEMERAFALIVRAKQLKTRCENLDALRATYYIKTNDYSSAMQSLLEELVHFPTNASAKQLLDNVSKHVDESVKTDDEEFNTLLRRIRPFTMLSIERLFALFNNAREICLANEPGNFVECGVARGGSSALLAYVIKHYSKRPRKLFSFDTFDGMPSPTAQDTHEGIAAELTGWGTGTCAAPMESVITICEDLGVSDVVVPVKGLFQETLPEQASRIGAIALLHMDGDWHASTWAILDNLYDYVDDMGYVQVDDYGHWEGCKKAIDEFEQQLGISLKLERIDDTGVWFRKQTQRSVSSDGYTMVNLGCGARIHPSWVNIDFVSDGNNVLAHDLKQGVPLNSSSCDVVYHSHVLEHFAKSEAPKFVRECYRVLKLGGVIRVVIPDLEQIVRHYLENMNRALDGDREAHARYDWMMLELYDQTVRNVSGGEMLRHWLKNPMPAEQFVFQRVGSEAVQAIASARQSRQPIGAADESDPCKIGRFRLSGEVHQWMYDRFSLSRLLGEVGFRDIKKCRADESHIQNFNSYLLDIEPDGSTRKPDSLFMEAVK